MPTYPFLSDDWIAEARKIFDDYRARADEEAKAAGRTIRMNQVITEVPFGDGTVEAHVDTSTGVLVIERGLLDSPDVTITLDHDTARRVFVDGDLQAAMQAFMAGRIRIDGDLSALVVALQDRDPAPLAGEVHERIRAITE